MLGDSDLTLQVDLDVHEVESPVVPMFDALVRLLVQQLLDFVPVLLELGSLNKLLSDLANKLGVDLNLLVILDELVHFLLSAPLVRDHVQSELLELIGILEFDHEVSLFLVYSVSLVADFKAFNLTYHIAAVVGHSEEAAADALLVVRVLNPTYQVTSADAYLLKVFKFHWLVDHRQIFRLVLLTQSFAVLRFTLIVAG